MYQLYPARVFVLVLLLILCPSVWAAGRSSESATVAEQYLLAAANQERVARGLPTLHRDPQLARAASQHAIIMAEHRSISHQFAGEPELTARGASNGVQFSVISENVAEAPSPIQIHDMWMHSEHHRANLLDPSVDSVGISVINRNGELFAVEDFAKSVRRVSFADQEQAIGELLEQRGLRLQSDPQETSAARQTCRLDSGYTGSRRPGFIMRFTSDRLTEIPSELKSRIATGRYHQAVVGACPSTEHGNFTSYNVAVLLYP